MIMESSLLLMILFISHIKYFCGFKPTNEAKCSTFIMQEMLQTGGCIYSIHLIYDRYKNHFVENRWVLITFIASYVCCLTTLHYIKQT